MWHLRWHLANANARAHTSTTSQESVALPLVGGEIRKRLSAQLEEQVAVPGLAPSTARQPQ